MMWFHRTKLLARLRVVSCAPELQNQVNYLKKHLPKNNGWFLLNLSHSYFHQWTMYVGLALEKNWQLPAARINDLTFRSLLILGYSGNLEKLLYIAACMTKMSNLAFVDVFKYMTILAISDYLDYDLEDEPLLLFFQFHYCQFLVEMIYWVYINNKFLSFPKTSSA